MSEPETIADVLGRAIERDTAPSLGEEQIRHMVSRFLAWKLPESFSPDGGIAFERFRRGGNGHPFRNEPVGTNLFSATEATGMVRHMLEGLPATDADGDTDEPRTAASLPGLISRIEISAIGLLDTLAEFDGIDRRWLAIGRTQIEQGFMALDRAMVPILPAPPDEGAEEETIESGWVIEDGASPVSAPTYFAGSASGPIFTPNHDLAMRFARRADAESFALMSQGSLDGVRICEHQWEAATAARPSSAALSGAQPRSGDSVRT